MVFRVLCMWVLDVFSKGKPFTVMTLLRKIRFQKGVTLVVYAQRGAADLACLGPKSRNRKAVGNWNVLQDWTLLCLSSVSKTWENESRVRCNTNTFLSLRCQHNLSKVTLFTKVLVISPSNYRHYVNKEHGWARSIVSLQEWRTKNHH